jgi:hypothetical protein
MLIVFLVRTSVTLSFHAHRALRSASHFLIREPADFHPSVFAPVAAKHPDLEPAARELFAGTGLSAGALFE